MKRDIRTTALYEQAETLCRTLFRPGTGQINDATEIRASPDGKQAVFTGTLMDELEGAPLTRICQVDLICGDIRILTFGPSADRLPKYAPDGRLVAFLSDRHRAGDFQLYLLDSTNGAVRSTPHVDGWVEYLHWSPDGERIILGVAGRGADTSSGQGAVSSKRAAEDTQPWMPEIATGNEAYRRRSAWAYELQADRVRQVSGAECNVWEAVWCGNEALAAVISPGSSEGLWYSTCLVLIAIETGAQRELYAPQYQLGWPAASPSGEYVAFVAAICSDRWFVAGDLHLIELASGKVGKIDTRGVDITYTEWRSNRHLLLAGHRGFETTVGIYDVSSDTFAETWGSESVTVGGPYAAVSGLNEAGDCVLLAERFMERPQVALIHGGQYRAVKSFDPITGDQASIFEERLTWQAPDGLEIQGWLLRPKDSPPHPLVMIVHGGPVGHWRPRWLGRSGSSILMLLSRGYAVFLPNPRGSSGRGQEFIRHVLGDMGGADTYDYLSGLDHLVGKGIADPRRLGVMGGSYGGFMTSWLITQDARFGAAVSVSPVTNHVSEHLISSLPRFTALFLADHYANPNGKYFQRSPIMHAHKAKTPTLNICGALDRCTPPQEAVQFHNALLENGVTSVLVTYPEEGHGVRKFPAVIDYTARVVAWFEEHLAQ
jgi:dipeptidyl aminopeptidase/acylaminoacyl peptidase